MIFAPCTRLDFSPQDITKYVRTHNGHSKTVEFLYQSYGLILVYFKILALKQMSTTRELCILETFVSTWCIDLMRLMQVHFLAFTRRQKRTIQPIRNS